MERFLFITNYCIVVFVTILSFCSCSEEEDQNRVPWARVYFKIDLRFDDKRLDTSGEYLTFPKPRLAGEYVGFSGLLIVAGLIPQTDGTPILTAYDLCCPNEASQSIKITPQANGKAICNTCKSVYNLYNGGIPESGPSTWRLKWYRTRVEQPYNGLFYIYN